MYTEMFILDNSTLMLRCDDGAGVEKTWGNE